MVSGNVTTTAQQLEQIKTIGFYPRYLTAYECIIDGCIVRRVNRKDEVPGYFVDNEWQPWGSFNGIADILSMIQFNVVGGRIIPDDTPEYPGRPITDDMYEFSLQGSIRGLDGQPVLDMRMVTMQSMGVIPITESRLSDIRFLVNDACRWYGDRKFKGRTQPDVPADKLKDVIQWIADMNPYAQAYEGKITCPEGEWARQMQIEYYQSIGMGSAINERTIDISDIARWLVEGPNKGSVPTSQTQFEKWFEQHHNEPQPDRGNFITRIESELMCDCYEAPSWRFKYRMRTHPDPESGVMDFIEIIRPPAIFDSEHMIRTPSTHTDGGGTDGSRWP